jgi:hypothetical protein
MVKGGGSATGEDVAPALATTLPGRSDSAHGLFDIFLFDVVAGPFCQDGARNKVNKMICPWRE